jgi:2-iminoacetate synthase
LGGKSKLSINRIFAECRTMSFWERIKSYRWDDIEAAIRPKTAEDVRRALQAPIRRFDDFLALLAPSAADFMEEMAQAAHRLTVRRFGRTIQMFAPIYMSNECTNACAYCGFNRHNRIVRATLGADEVVDEAKVLHRQGFRHILLLTGESPQYAPVDYLIGVARKLQRIFASISIEIYPLSTDDYRRLILNGVDGLTIFQETYNLRQYAKFHPSGPKHNYRWRLETPDRGGRAGFRRLNIGALLGLCDWRVEGAFLGLHADYLVHRYWQSSVSISFPRLRPAAGGFQPPFPVRDAHMVQLMCALRLWLPDAGLVLSTREPATLRDNLLPLGITQMSAGSKTAPGGYAAKEKAESQFEVCDLRSPKEVADMIAGRGYEPVWKDWDTSFLNA